VHGLANHTILIARDGSECAIADSCAPIRDRDGQVVGAVLIFRDVTKEYAAQQALRDSSALIQTILNTVVDGVITIHASGAIVETVNPAAERMFGYAAAELSGQKLSLLIPELDRDQRHGSLEYYSASDEARAAGIGREVLGQRKDGTVFPLEITVSDMCWRQALFHRRAARYHRAQAHGRGAAQGGRAAERDFQQRQLLQHRHRREGRDPDFQRRAERMLATRPPT